MDKIDIASAVAWASGITAIVSAIMGTLVFVVTKNRSKSAYDSARNAAVLSEMRIAYDSQLARISSQLMATEERWRDTNHLLISSQNHQSVELPASKPHFSRFVADLGIDQSSITVDPKMVFYLTPFAPEEEKLFIRIQRICAVSGLTCVRGDETHAQGDILPHIVRLILSSRIIIANITTRNPNVFYELGLANALDKQSILIAKSVDDLPFDIQSKRTIIYRNFQELEQRLARTFIRIFSAGD